MPSLRIAITAWETALRGRSEDQKLEVRRLIRGVP